MSTIAPYHLPQIRAPLNYVLNKLDVEGIQYQLNLNHDLDDLKPSQPFVISDIVSNVNMDDPLIWISNENRILDGHHTWMRCWNDNISCKSVQVKLNFKDSCRILNKIQDIYEYEQSREMEEVVSQDVINYYGDDENQFLKELENSNQELNDGEPNNKVITAYRKDPIRENSVVGNFFLLKPQDGFDKYEIEFDNLLDMGSLGVTYKDGQEPVDILAKIWFPNINFEKIGSEQDVPAINIKNKAVAEKAMRMGYDGILYNNVIVQGLK
jgi:hypothetical protein